eukprot:8987345-Alexandrium_andersonii.AAC.1
MQLVKGAARLALFPSGAVPSPLRVFEVPPVDQVALIAELGRPPLRIGPDARALAVGRSVHAVVDPDKREPRDDFAGLQEPGIG